MQELRIRSLLVVVAGLLTIIAADHLGIFAGINSYCYNLAFRVRGPERPSPQLLIAAIDEKTLAGLGRWPLERSRYAQLLDALPEARAVGFTIIMAEPTTDDAMLARSATAFGRAVFPSYIDHGHRLQLAAGELARLPVGHIHVEQDISGEAIGVFTSLRQGQGKSQPAFASTITAVANGSRRAPSAAPSSDTDLSDPEIRQSTLMRINYSGPPGTFPAVSFADILAGKFGPEYFHDKIVLVGITAAGIGEGLLTPFSQNRDRMASVEVQANIVNNLLKGNGIQVPGEGSRLFLCLTMSLALFLVFTFLPEASATVVWLLTLSGVTTAVSLIFSQSQIWLPPALFWICATFLYVMAILFKLDKAATRLQQECSEISLHLGPEAGEQCRLETASGLIGHLSLGGINRKAVILGEATGELMRRSKEKEAANRELEKKHAEVTELKTALEHRVRELEEALARVRQLEEMLPICMYCKKIRDDKDYWERLESYFEKHAGVMFTHSVCPDCYQNQLLEIEETERLKEALDREETVTSCRDTDA